MVSVYVTPNVQSKIGQNKADVAAFNAFPLTMLNSSLVRSVSDLERAHRRSTQPVALSIGFRASLCVVLAAPGEQIGRKIGGWLAFAMRVGRKRLRIEFRLNRRPVEMPRGVPEQRDDDGKAEEER
jgi:hypothetical protein